MTAPNEYYCDPAIDAASGLGTSGSPWGDIQHALDSITQDTSDGDRLNILAGTDEVLTAALSLASYGAPSETAPLVIQGYTATEGDGGIGGIDGDATYGMLADSGIDDIVFRDMHLHNSGAAKILFFDNYCKVVNCEINNTSGGGVEGGFGISVYGCHIHDIGGIGVKIDGPAEVSYCYFKNDGGNDMSKCVDFTNVSDSQKTIIGNIVSVDGTTAGFDITGTGGSVCSNSLFTSGTGVAIDINQSAAGRGGGCMNNLLEGWTTGILGTTISANGAFLIAGNAGYDNGTDFNLSAEAFLVDDNESLGASPFDKSGSDTYALRLTHFNPVDTGNVYSPFGGMSRAKGAIPPAPGFAHSITVDLQLQAADRP